MFMFSSAYGLFIHRPVSCVKCCLPASLFLQKRTFLQLIYGAFHGYIIYCRRSFMEKIMVYHLFESATKNDLDRAVIG